MLTTVRGVVQDGAIRLLERVDIPEGTEILVTILSEEKEFWLGVSQGPLAGIWDNVEDDVYEQLLEG